MCVVLVATDKRPSAELVEKAFDFNPEGAGAAYRDNGEVVWEKGCSLARMKELAATMPLPFVQHFRISSNGKENIRPEMTHPFPISNNTSLELKGRTKGSVLFHNGHWGAWRPTILEFSKLAGGKAILPTGKWNDTRAMAWYASYVGLGILDIIDEKTVAFGPDEFEVFGKGWVMIEGVLASNNSFEYGMRNRGGFEYRDPGTVATTVERPIVGLPPISGPGATLAAAAALTAGTGGKVQVHKSAPDTEVIDLRSKDVSVSRNGEIAVRNPGVSAKVLPFVKGVPRGVPLAELRRMHVNGSLSKNKLKKAEKAFYKAQQDLVKKFSRA